jgi:Phage tail tube protein, GTA-gp10
MNSSTAPLPTGAVTIEYGGASYRLVLDWTAIAWFERQSGASLLEVYAGMAQGMPKLSLLAYLLHAGLQQYHPEVDFDTAGRMSLDEGVRAALDLATEEAMPAQAGTVGNGAAAAEAIPADS